MLWKFARMKIIEFATIMKAIWSGRVGSKSTPCAKWTPLVLPSELSFNQGYYYNAEYSKLNFFYNFN